MAILPQLKAMFEAQHSAPPPATSLSPQQLRAEMHKMIDQSFMALQAPRAPAAVERDVSIPVSGGEIGLRLYRPGTSEVLPIAK